VQAEAECKLGGKEKVVCVREVKTATPTITGTVSEIIGFTHFTAAAGPSEADAAVVLTAGLGALAML